MFGLAQFQKMKSTAYIINTARGGLVGNDALYTALSQALIAGAALDVTEPEPINPDNPLLKPDNVILTGHSTYYSETSVIEQRKGPVDEIARVPTGEWPRALINPQVKEKFMERWKN
jgi:D-3-phosphoglycerate dehydrogenase